MNNLKFISPFKCMCVTVGNLPTAYMESMSYYEALTFLVKYLENTVIPTLNNHTEAINELQEAYTELKKYVDDYFENLDIQTEIDNKLDEMASDGTLERLIGDYALKKVDYLEISDETEAEVQEIFDIERAKVISFKNDYTFTSTKILNKDTTLLLNGNTLTFNIPSVTEDWTLSHGFFNFKPDDEFLEYSGNGNINILNGTIEGGNCSFIHGANINIKNIHFKNCQNDHIIELCAMNGVNIENCIFEGTPADADQSKENIQLDNCTALNFPFFTDSDNPTYDNTPTQNITIKNNIFKKPSNVNYGFSVGIGMHGFENSVYHTNIDIRNNEFIDMTNMAIQLINTKNVNIENNKFSKNGYTVDMTGAMIRFRNENENIEISKNEFDGNVRAIETANVPLLCKDIKIINNLFKNYKYSDQTLAAINVSNPLDIIISNNIFTDFTQNLIRLNTYGEPEDLTIFNTYIENNIFKSVTAIAEVIIKCYVGNAYINNNTFDADGLSYGYPCVLTTNDGNFIKLYAKGNEFSQNLIQATQKTIVDLNETNQYYNVYGVPVRGYTGTISTLSLDDQALSVPYSHFNRIILTLGDGLHTQVYKLAPFEIKLKLDNRTFTIPTVNISTNSVEVTTLTLNEDGTFDYSSTGTPLRNFELINE